MESISYRIKKIYLSVCKNRSTLNSISEDTPQGKVYKIQVVGYEAFGIILYEADHWERPWER
jgi:hypothetical protein